MLRKACLNKELTFDHIDINNNNNDNNGGKTTI